MEYNIVNDLYIHSRTHILKSILYNNFIINSFKSFFGIVFVVQNEFFLLNFISFIAFFLTRKQYNKVKKLLFRYESESYKTELWGQLLMDANGFGNVWKFYFYVY